MHQSGIVVDDELKEAFRKACEDPSVGYLKVVISDSNDKFVLDSTGTGDLDAIGKTLESNIPAYIVTRKQDKWLMVSFVPDTAKVRSKMVYASSTASLRHGLGGANFISPDYAANTLDDVTENSYSHSIEDHSEVVMSFNEKEKLETEMQSAMLMGAEPTTVIAGVPIKISDTAMQGFKDLKAGTFNTLKLVLDPKTEILNVGMSQDMSLTEIQGCMEERVPSYFLHNFKYNHPEDGQAGSKNVFIYYCPNLAPPKLKMLYSTCKAYILTGLSELEFEKPLNMECNVPAEISDKSVHDEIFPPKVEDKSFAKPKAARGGRRAVAKFQA